MMGRRVLAGEAVVFSVLKGAVWRDPARVQSCCEFGPDSVAGRRDRRSWLCGRIGDGDQLLFLLRFTCLWRERLSTNMRTWI